MALTTTIQENGVFFSRWNDDINEYATDNAIDASVVRIQNTWEMQFYYLWMLKDFHYPLAICQ